MTMAAQIATLPVLALTFGEVSLIAPIANLLTVPLLAPLLVLGGLLASVGALGSRAIGCAGGGIELGCLAAALVCQRYDSTLRVATGRGAGRCGLPLVVAWGYYLLLTIGGWRLRPFLRRLTAARSEQTGMFALAGARLSCCWLSRCLALAGRPRLHWPLAKQPISTFSMSVRVARRRCVRLPSGVTALMDGGPDGPTLEGALAGHLPFWQHSLDLAVLTDHRAGACAD